MKSISFIFVVFLSSYFLMFSACKKNATTSTTTSYTPSCSGTKSFSVDVKPLFQTYCASCHSNYSTYTQISSSASSIRSSIVDGSMPKSSTLTEAQKNSIVCWIDAGTLNN